MEEGGTAVIANYINLNRCATTPWMLVFIFELLKSSLEWSQEQAMLFLGCSMHSWARGGMYMGLRFSPETVSWGQILQRAKCSHSLVFSGNIKPEGTYMGWRDPLPLCMTPLCSLLKSLKFLGTACVSRWHRCMQRDADLAGATEQHQRQHPFRKGGSEPGWFGAREEVPAFPRCSTAPSLFGSTLPPCGSQVEIQTDAHVQEGGTSWRSFGCSLGQSCRQQMHMSLRKCLVPESIQLLMIGVWHLLRPKHWLRAWKVQLAREGVCLFANRESYAKTLTLGTDLRLLARPNLHVCPLWGHPSTLESRDSLGSLQMMNPCGWVSPWAVFIVEHFGKVGKTTLVIQGFVVIDI